MLPLPLIVMAIDNEHDRDKMIEIYNKYYSTMMYTAMSIMKDRSLAEDVVSESIIKIISNLDKISDISCYKTRHYIVTIVRNTAINLWNKRTRHEEHNLDDNEEIAEGNISILEQLSSAEGVKVIADAIISLPKNLSDPIYLSVVKGYSDIEISRELGISHAAVRMRLLRARSAIKSKLEGELNGK